MFQLTKSEWEIMSSQIVTTSLSKRPKTAIPYAFTEHGVIMLSSILKSETAIQVNIAVARAFVAVRQMIAANPMALRLSSLEHKFEQLKQDLEEIFRDYNDINEDTRAQLESINTALADLQSDTRPRRSSHRRIGFSPE